MNPVAVDIHFLREMVLERAAGEAFAAAGPLRHRHGAPSPRLLDRVLQSAFNEVYAVTWKPPSGTVMTFEQGLEGVVGRRRW